MRHFNGHFAKKNYDQIGYIMVAVAFMATFPQIIQIYQTRSVEDLSIYSWIMYLSISTFWFLYGVKRKLLPLMGSGMVNMFLDGLVVTGIFLFR